MQISTPQINHTLQAAPPSTLPSSISLDWALYYASLGIHVFPVHFIMDGGTCSCADPKCERPGKHPMTAHGLKDATTDRAIIEYWWGGEPDANIGLRTGAVSGIIVLDEDPDKGGSSSLAELVAKHGPLPVGPRTRTGGGGTHYFFRHPGGGQHIGNRQNMLPGLDLRGDGGYVVAAGSNHVDGDYIPEPGHFFPDVPLAAMPSWLTDLVVNNDAKAAATISMPGDDEPIGKGKRHPTLFSMAGVMRAKGMSRAAIEAALKAENLRCSPPLSDQEIQKLVAGVMKYPSGELPKGKIHSYSVRDGVVSELKEQFESAADPKVTQHQVQWIVRGLVAVGAITLVTGKPKLSGKSTLVGHMLACIVKHRHFLKLLTVQSPVVILTEERNTFTELLERVGLKGQKDVRFLRFDPSRDATFAEQVKAARELCKEIGAKVLVVDTIAQFMALRGDTENEAGAALEALKPIQGAAQDGLAVIAVHHEKKSGGDVGDSGRGSSAFMGAVDIILSLRRPEGQTSPRVRVIHSLSRFEATPGVLYIELTDSGYESREEAAVVSSAVEKTLLENAPRNESEAQTLSDLLAGTELKESTAKKVMKALVDQGKLQVTGEGKKGSPLRYWKQAENDSDTSHSPTDGTESAAPGMSVPQISPIPSNPPQQ